MLVEPDMTTLARMLADRSRAAILLALVGGEAYPATELARIAHVSASTASSHLHKLLDTGLITQESTGRHRYYRLANAAAPLIETFAVSAPRPAASSAIDRFRSQALTIARTCYDHLAGRLGVAIATNLEQRGVLRAIEREYEITAAGRQFFHELGLDVSDLPPRRVFARRCLDWSERRPHIAGALGAALAAHCFEHDWIMRVRGSRAVRVTPLGAKAFAKYFDVRLG